jgi:hypothetical protein
MAISMSYPHLCRNSIPGFPLVEACNLSSSSAIFQWSSSRAFEIMTLLSSLGQPASKKYLVPQCGVLVSPHSLQDCVDRFAQAVDSPFVFFGRKPVVGSARGDVLRARKRIRYRNSWQTTVRAELEACSQGTLVRYRLRVNPMVTVIMGLWVAWVVLIGGIVALSSVHKIIHGDSRAWVGVLVPVGMLVFEQALVRFGKMLARGEAVFLLEFLQGTLQALPVHDPRMRADYVYVPSA